MQITSDLITFFKRYFLKLRVYCFFIGVFSVQKCNWSKHLVVWFFLNVTLLLNPTIYFSDLLNPSPYLLFEIITNKKKSTFDSKMCLWPPFSFLSPLYIYYLLVLLADFLNYSSSAFFSISEPLLSKQGQIRHLNTFFCFDMFTEN